jgi:putative tricarboxylic transport membrane protein
VTVGGGGWSELSEYVTAGKLKAVAVTSGARLKGINVPTLKEQGINVEIGNWRGVYGAPGIDAAQRKALTDMVLAALKTKSWAESLEKNAWTPAVLSGPAFDKFVDDDFASLRATMVKSGMI